jgi:hypothetical protein
VARDEGHGFFYGRSAKACLPHSGKVALGARLAARKV